MLFVRVCKEVPRIRIPVVAKLCLIISAATPVVSAWVAPIKAPTWKAPGSVCIGRGSRPLQMAENNWMDVLKFQGSTPSFDVIQKTQEYTSHPGYRSFRLKDIPTDYYSTDYVFRGPVIGPVNRKDLVETNTLFGFGTAFPDLDRQPFGFAVDPENPFRALYFERWKATHKGELLIPNTPLKSAATGKTVQTPVFPFSVVWNPEGQIIYEHLGASINPWEGENSGGKAAVFGMLEAAGFSVSSRVGDPLLILVQKLGRLSNQPGQVYSKPEDLPTWWKGTAVGAEPER